MRWAVALAAAALAVFLLWRAFAPKPPAPAALNLAPPDAKPAPRSAPSRSLEQISRKAAATDGGPSVGKLAATAPKEAAAIAGSADGAAEKERILDDILRSGNDNDPRLDTAFGDLSPKVKAAFRQKYRALPQERRNDRGTILYILGQNLRRTEDWAVMREAVAERPCLSLADCAKPPAPDGEEMPGAAVTLSYPALVALRQAETALKTGDEAAKREALAVIQLAQGSKAPIVAQKAAQLAGR